MSDLTPRPADVLITLGARKLANIIVEMALSAGTETRWDDETIEHVLTPLERTFRDLGIPGVGNTGEDEDARKYWLIEQQRENHPDWVLVDHFIDLGQRTNEEGYIDSIKLIHSILTGPGSEERMEYKAELDQALELDLAQIDDSGQDLDTMTDLLTEWEERAEESDLHAYADGEAGVYRVTNIPEED